MAGAMAAHATLMAYEGFDITEGEDALNDAAGATSVGWVGAWTNNAAQVLHDIIPGRSYQNQGTLDVVGGAVRCDAADSNAFRNLSQSFSTGTVWISFIGVVPTNNSYAVVSIFNNFNNELLAIGDLSSSTNWGFQTLGTGGVIGSTTINVTNQSFLVVQIDFKGGLTNSHNAYLWVNPALSATAPLVDSSAAQLTNFTFPSALPATRVRVRQGTTGDNAIFDEIRVGTTWQDVTPYTSSYTPPNPASFGAMSLSTGLFQFSVTNLTVGATNDLQRSYDLLGGLWETATTFVATTTTSNLTDAVGSSNAVLYRVTSY
jgi:hypothetical protein